MRCIHNHLWITENIVSVQWYSEKERKETPGKGDVIHMRSSSSCSNESDGQHSSRGVKTKNLRRDE
ncbi:hypothetical protein NC653_020706 [Populus alba x Populus x berolinensis]|uniref:Uncharacterized protein n=1 Tax=Populus alba x Populus x berolinensis TaxID=444605 RepID=A0AAD6QCR2_9ROSI|nr:hypothetical protein NC653_020706 [Populus alba x Populus x berolinensis]